MKRPGADPALRLSGVLSLCGRVVSPYQLVKKYLVFRRGTVQHY
jgi:hypothetical protein